MVAQPKSAEAVPAQAAALISEYNQWASGRAVLSEAETAGDYPTANQWAASDDWGADLLDRLAPVLDQVVHLVTATDDRSPQ